MSTAFLSAQSPDDAALADVRLDQNLNDQLPLDTEWRDEHDTPVTLSQYFHNEKPVIIVPVYYRCPMLCTQVLNELVRTAGRIDLRAGDAFEVVIFSIDARETPTLAAQKKLNYLREYKGDESTRGWHFLTGDQPAIDQLAGAVGFGYHYDEDRDIFAHPAAVIFATPDGKTARYIIGLDYTPRDLKFAIIESSKGRIGSVVDHILLRCFPYDPATGRYGFAIMAAIRIGGVLTVLAIVTGIIYYTRRSARLNASSKPAEAITR
jgi:protein SCO1/2